jgi:DNA-binding MurR/RpiR family transcriptional regulator
MSISRLARACGASKATVSRFCKVLGYSGYKAFQLDLAAAVARSDDEALDHFSSGASPEVIVRRVFACNRQSLIETEQRLDPMKVVRIASRLRRARRIVFIGIGESARVGQSAAQRLTSLGLDAVAVADPYEQIFATAGVGPRDVVVGISHTGHTMHVVEALRTARRKGACTVAITNYPDSPLVGACEFSLITAFREHRVNAAVSSSRIAQACVIDSLYFVAASGCSRKARRLADDAERRVRRMLRVRPETET